MVIGHTRAEFHGQQSSDCPLPAEPMANVGQSIAEVKRILKLKPIRPYKMPDTGTIKARPRYNQII